MSAPGVRRTYAIWLPGARAPVTLIAMELVEPMTMLQKTLGDDLQRMVKPEVVSHHTHDWRLECWTRVHQPSTLPINDLATSVVAAFRNPHDWQEHIVQSVVRGGAVFALGDESRAIKGLSAPAALGVVELVLTLDNALASVPRFGGDDELG